MACESALTRVYHLEIDTDMGGCSYYPCHDLTMVSGQFCCKHCFCPLYNKECPGTYVMLENGIKDCSKCLFNHLEENQIMLDIVRTVHMADQLLGAQRGIIVRGKFSDDIWQTFDKMVPLGFDDLDLMIQNHEHGHDVHRFLLHIDPQK